MKLNQISLNETISDRNRELAQLSCCFIFHSRTDSLTLKKRVKMPAKIEPQFNK